MRAAFLAVIFSIAAGRCPLASERTPAVRDVLDSMDTSFQICNWAEYRAHCKAYKQGGDYREQTLIREGRWSVRRRDSSWKILSEVQNVCVYKGAPVCTIDRWEHILSAGESLTIGTEGPAQGVRYVIADRKISDEDRLVIFAEDEFMWVHGHHRGNGLASYLPARLRECCVEVKRDSLDGREALFLQGKGRYGTYRVWVDPEEGYLPRRLTLTKEGSDILEKTTVSAIPGLRTASFTVEIGRFEHPEGKPVPAAFVTERRDVFQSEEVIVRSICELSDIRLRPELSSPEAFAPTTRIPDGTPVQVEDAPHLDYVWENGHVVSAVDAQLASRLGGHRVLVAEGFARFRFLLVAAGVVALLLVVIVGAVRGRGRVGGGHE